MQESRLQQNQQESYREQEQGKFHACDPRTRYFVADFPSALTTSTVSVRAGFTAGMTSMT